jgi:phenylacetate-CoA ligase
MRRMEKVTGRSDDMIILRGVNVFPTQIEEQLLKVSGLSPHFQLELKRVGRLDEMTVHVEPMAGVNDNAQLVHLAAELKRRVKDQAGLSVAVKLHETGQVPRSEGKAVRIIDRRGG